MRFRNIGEKKRWQCLKAGCENAAQMSLLHIERAELAASIRPTPLAPLLENREGKTLREMKRPFVVVYSPFHVEENTFVVRDTGAVGGIWQSKGEFGKSLGCDPLHMYVASTLAKQSAFASMLWPTVARFLIKSPKSTQVR